MRRWHPGRWAVLAAVAVVAAAAGGGKEPMFVRWLVDSDPSDQTIREYWQRGERGELVPEEMVDLGTMLFHRGYPKDATRYFRRALEQDSKLYEAWFRIGLVEHREGRLRNAEEAYQRCLKLLTGHGWCNFYLGRLKEQTGHPKQAIEYYRRAFKFAPELADPKVNPELLYSDLQLAAQIGLSQRERFADAAPMPYLQPDRVEKVRAQFEPTPPPTAAAETPAPDTRTVTVVREKPTATPAEMRPALPPTIRSGRTLRPTPAKTPVQPGLPPRVMTASPEASLGSSWSPWGGIG